MNAVGFLVRRIAWQFGMRRERQRWADVNRETQIVSELEELLGRAAWRDVQDIEDISGEYWQLVELDEQQLKLREEARQADIHNNTLKAQLAEIEEGFAETVQKARSLKSHRKEDSLALMREIDQLRGWKGATRQKFASLKVKLQVLHRQRSSGRDVADEESRTLAAMKKLKEDFATDISQIRDKEREIKVIDQEVAELERQIIEGKASSKSNTAHLTGDISRFSKLVAECSARIGALENRKTDFYSHIGRYLTENLDKGDPEVRRVVRRHRPLLAKLAYFRRSISYNQRLARRTSGR